MWAYNMPAELLRVLTWAARDDEVVMRFEGNSISSRDLGTGLATEPPVDVDAVSLLAVPHLDRIYFEMGRRSAGRGKIRTSGSTPNSTGIMWAMDSGSP